MLQCVLLKVLTFSVSGCVSKLSARCAGWPSRCTHAIACPWFATVHGHCHCHGATATGVRSACAAQLRRAASMLCHGHAQPSGTGGEQSRPVRRTRPLRARSSTTTRASSTRPASPAPCIITASAAPAGHGLATPTSRARPWARLSSRGEERRRIWPRQRASQLQAAAQRCGDGGAQDGHGTHIGHGGRPGSLK